MNHTINDATTESLIKLWTSREKVLTEAAMLEVAEPLRTRLKDMANCYGQCAEELKNVPEKLLISMGF